MRGLIATILLVFSHTSVAGDLSTFVTDLYGGDGIRLAVDAGFSHDAHFTADSLAALQDLNSAVTSAVGFSAFNSPVSGVTFDLSTGVPVATEESLGPLLSERATTIGKNRLNISFSYTRVDFDRFEGTELDEFNLVFPHNDCCGGPGFTTPDGMVGGTPFTAFENDTIDVMLEVELEQNVFALFGNYGITDRWDVGIVIPIIDITARASAFATVNNTTGFNFHRFEGAEDVPTSSSGGSQTGIGDIILRTKWNFLKNHEFLPDMAVTGQITVPTGDEDDLLGTGEARYRGQFVTSKKFGTVTPHLNVAYEVTSGPDDLNNLTYALGFDWRAMQKLTVAADVLGRYNPDLSVISDHLIDVALAAKWNPFNNHEAPLNAYVILPVNKDSGLRSDVIWGLGVEYTFQ